MALWFLGMHNAIEAIDSGGIEFGIAVSPHATKRTFE